MISQRHATVRQTLLYPTADQEVPGIKLDSTEWYSWLEQQDSFRFEAAAASFTARKEERSGNWYWYAYRKRHGKLNSMYIGKSEDVTSERLNIVAEMLLRQDDLILVASTSSGGVGIADRGSGIRSVGGPIPTPASRYPRSPFPGEAQTGPEPTPPEALPLPLTPLVDRVEDVAAVITLLRRSDVRSVTLVGAGGIGKTRIGLEVAASVQHDFADGVYFLCLDSVREVQLALSRVAQVFGLSPDGHKSVMDLLKASLEQKELLLFLDNLEQMAAAAPLLVDLLSACPGLKMLLTSREVLHMSGEHPFVVAPLPFPDPADLPPLDTLLSYPAVELFVQRARAIAPGLPLGGATMQAIAAICARLEGLPLAIELAAARVRLLPPEALLERLAHRLEVLTQGGADRPARQQTLRATLDWSHDLLSLDEQLVLRRLAVFAGGCEMEAAEAVCTAFGDITAPFLDVLSSLIDKSLLLSVDPALPRPRLRLAETVREYALESLVQSRELQAAEEAHASYYLSFAVKAAPELERWQQDGWLERLYENDQNLNAALNFLLSSRDRVRAVRLAGALGRFWYLRGRLSEGLSWTEQALALRGHAAVDLGAAEVPEDRKALIAAGLFALHLDEGESTRALLEESLDICWAAGDDRGCALASYMLALLFLLNGDLAAGQSQVEKTLALGSQSVDPWVMATVQNTSGALAMCIGDFAHARLHLERSAALFKEAGDLYLSDLTLLLVAGALAATGDKAQGQALLEQQIGKLQARRSAGPAGYLLCAYGRLALGRGDWSRARLLLERGLALFNRLRDARGMARAYLLLAQAALYQQDYTTAITMAKSCLQRAQTVGAIATLIGCLEGLADAAVRRGKGAWAAQLWGAAERQRKAADPRYHPTEPSERAHLLQAAREALGTKVFDAAWDEGHSLPLEQLLSVENLANSVRKHPGATSQRPAGLTPREIEVLLLVADGLSNAEIADRLVISPATVISYLNIIYKKLNVSSRTAAMRYAIDHQLNSVAHHPENTYQTTMGTALP